MSFKGASPRGVPTQKSSGRGAAEQAKQEQREIKLNSEKSSAGLSTKSSTIAPSGTSIFERLAEAAKPKENEEKKSSVVKFSKALETSEDNDENTFKGIFGISSEDYAKLITEPSSVDQTIKSDFEKNDISDVDIDYLMGAMLTPEGKEILFGFLNDLDGFLEGNYPDYRNPDCKLGRFKLELKYKKGSLCLDLALGEIEAKLNEGNKTSTLGPGDYDQTSTSSNLKLLYDDVKHHLDNIRDPNGFCDLKTIEGILAFKGSSQDEEDFLKLFKAHLINYSEFLITMPAMFGVTLQKVLVKQGIIEDASYRQWLERGLPKFDEIRLDITRQWEFEILQDIGTFHALSKVSTIYFECRTSKNSYYQDGKPHEDSGLLSRFETYLNKHCADLENLKHLEVQINRTSDENLIIPVFKNLEIIVIDEKHLGFQGGKSVKISSSPMLREIGITSPGILSIDSQPGLEKLVIDEVSGNLSIDKQGVIQFSLHPRIHGILVVNENQTDSVKRIIDLHDPFTTDFSKFNLGDPACLLRFELVEKKTKQIEMPEALQVILPTQYCVLPNLGRAFVITGFTVFPGEILRSLSSLVTYAVNSLPPREVIMSDATLTTLTESLATALKLFDTFYNGTIAPMGDSPIVLEYIKPLIGYITYLLSELRELFINSGLKETIIELLKLAAEFLSTPGGRFMALAGFTIAVILINFVLQSRRNKALMESSLLKIKSIKEGKVSPQDIETTLESFAGMLGSNNALYQDLGIESLYELIFRYNLEVDPKMQNKLANYLMSFLANPNISQENKISALQLLCNFKKIEDQTLEQLIRFLTVRYQESCTKNKLFRSLASIVLFNYKETIVKHRPLGEVMANFSISILQNCDTESGHACLRAHGMLCVFNIELKDSSRVDQELQKSADSILNSHHSLLATYHSKKYLSPAQKNIQSLKDMKSTLKEQKDKQFFEKVGSIKRSLDGYRGMFLVDGLNISSPKPGLDSSQKVLLEEINELDRYDFRSSSSI